MTTYFLQGTGKIIPQVSTIEFKIISVEVCDGAL